MHKPERIPVSMAIDRDDSGNVSLYALCSDGSLWRLEDEYHGDWFRVGPAIPESSAFKYAEQRLQEMADETL